MDKLVVRLERMRLKRATNPADPAGSIGAQIRAARLARGLTQLELARLAGVSLSAVSRLERDEVRSPGLAFLNALSTPLQISVPPLAHESAELGLQGAPAAPIIPDPAWVFEEPALRDVTEQFLSALRRRGWPAVLLPPLIINIHQEARPVCLVGSGGKFETMTFVAWGTGERNQRFLNAESHWRQLGMGYLELIADDFRSDPAAVIEHLRKHTGN